MKEKVTEICQLIPAFGKEIDRRPGKTQESKDYCIYRFKNGSYFDNLAATERSRGKRRQGGLMEECATIDGDILSSVILPTMNISRRCMDGTVHPEETLNKSQNFITTAGYKNTFAYDKLIQLLIWMILQPEKSIIMGGTYRIPVLMKLLDNNFVEDLKQDGTYDDASFDREYNSHWSGTTEDAFFNGEYFDRNRTVIKAEEGFTARQKGAKTSYVISVDVGRSGCDTVICILKLIPQSKGGMIKALVNIYTLTDEHFEKQAIFIKQLYYKYKATRIVIDGNGIGMGLMDYMVKSQYDDEMQDVLPDFGVVNDEKGLYKKYKTNNTVIDAIYIIKANAALNSEAHAIVQSALTTNKIKFLIDERNAKARLMEHKVGRNMLPEEREDYLRPYTLTSILKMEMLNLRENLEGINIVLKPVNKNVHKDKFSALEYGLYYIKKFEETSKRRKFKMSDMMFST